MIIEFHVETTPIAQPRQRHRIIEPKGRSPFVSNYVPAKHPVNDYKNACRAAAWDAYQGQPLEGPLRMHLVFVLPRPKNKVWVTKPMPRYRHHGKPDRDNLMKSTQDAMEGVLFKNDSQLCDGTIQKWVAAGDEEPHVEVTLEVIE